MYFVDDAPVSSVVVRMKTTLLVPLMNVLAFIKPAKEPVFWPSLDFRMEPVPSRANLGVS